MSKQSKKDRQSVKNETELGEGSLRDQSSEESTARGPENRPYAMDETTLKNILDGVMERNMTMLMRVLDERREGEVARPDGGVRGERPPHNQPDFDYARATQNFKRRMPSFEIGTQPFEQFRLDFKLSADQSGFDTPTRDHPRFNELMDKRGTALKGLFYQCLSAEAKALAGRRLYPTGDECQPLYFGAYVEKLRLLFEPPSESETARQEFLARRQHKEENPLLYLSDKITLFERAFAAEKRDWNLLFDNTTDGLFNETLRKEMRKVVSANEGQYGEQLSFHINAIRKSVIAGDLAESEAKGTHTYSTTSSYLAQKHGGQAAAVKNEPGVFSMNHQSVDAEVCAMDKNYPKSANAKKFKLRCYHCQKTGHFARECTRKLAGLPAVKRDSSRILAVIEAPSESSDDMDEITAEINAMRMKPRRVHFKDKNKVGKQPPKRRAMYEMATDDSRTTDGESNPEEVYEQCESGPEAGGSGPNRSNSSRRSVTPPRKGGYTPPAARQGVHTMEDADILEAIGAGDSFLDL